MEGTREAARFKNLARIRVNSLARANEEGTNTILMLHRNNSLGVQTLGPRWANNAHPAGAETTYLPVGLSVTKPTRLLTSPRSLLYA
jgi:hypothetical protein